ncbi:MAG: hypothetical protein U9N35_04535 [Euryarchaeota archaeon]|nr:hypothetical protein [Euryarchaeota archaeon]
MKKYLVFNAFGVFIIKNGEIIGRKFFKNPHKPERNIKKLYKKHPDAVLENKEMAKKLNAEYEFPNEGGAYLRSNLDSIMEMDNEYYIERTKKKIKKASEHKDNLAIRSVEALEQVDESLNYFSERLREWYGLYSPEISDSVEDPIAFIEMVKGEKRKEKSMGADMEKRDLEAMKIFAEELERMYNMREELAAYVEESMETFAPNMSNLISPVLAAKLISLAGSLKGLARLPASTVQLLGAESALFRHLRKGTKPPKHGIIFQDPRIHNAPEWQRGKIARSLASKIAIAAKLDFYSGKFDESIAEKFEKRLASIRKKRR